MDNFQTIVDGASFDEHTLSDEKIFEFLSNMPDIEQHLIVGYISQEDYDKADEGVEIPYRTYAFVGTFQEQSEQIEALLLKPWFTYTYYTALEQREAYRRKLLTGQASEGFISEPSDHLLNLLEKNNKLG